MTTADFDLQGINIYLIGMMGAGKSTVGQLLARALDYCFLDTDAVIEQAANQPIATIFAEAGEREFRALETQVLSQLAAHKRLVIATGGGIVLERINWSYLQYGLVVWLDVSAAILWARLQGDTTRPLLQNANPKQTLEHLLAQRQPLYNQADLRIEIAHEQPPECLIQNILAAIPSVLKP
jgi:shikimate kinase